MVARERGAERVAEGRLRVGLAVLARGAELRYLGLERRRVTPRRGHREPGELEHGLGVARRGGAHDALLELADVGAGLRRLAGERLLERHGVEVAVARLAQQRR